MALETVVSFTGDTATQAGVDVIARAFVDRFDNAYRAYLRSGGKAFDAGVWYRLEVNGTSPTIRVIVVVPVPVYGLGPFVSELAAGLGEHYGWHFDLGTSVVLTEDTDTKNLEACGWRMLDFPPEAPAPSFSTDPPLEDQLSLAVHG